MSSPYLVRKAEVADAEAFAGCLLDCWREAYSTLWSAERFAEHTVESMAEQTRAGIEAGVNFYHVAEADGEVIGVAIAGPSTDDDSPIDLQLHAIYVRKSQQGTGVATELLHAAIGDSPATLWVYRDNPRASAFYINEGFIPDGAERVDPSGILEIRFSRR